MMSHIYLSEYNACPLNASSRHIGAVKAGRFEGRNVYRVPVMIRENSSRHCRTVSTRWIVVLAKGAADAADWVRDQITRPETEVIAVGPKGGEVYRYVGWHSAIAREIFGTDRAPNQLNLI